MLKNNTHAAILILVLLAGCVSDKKEKPPPRDRESPFFDYKVWGDEESGIVTTRIQYRHYGPGGGTILLEEPSKVELDGAVLQPDSAKMNGVYYEVIKPVAEFAGNHIILFTSPGGKEYKEEFSFSPFSLKTEIPAVLNRADLVLELDGLGEEDYIKVLMTDTSAFGEGITRTDTVKNGRITITAGQLSRLANGPIFFELFRDEDRRVENGTRRGGRLSISYGLKREFELADSLTR